MKNTIYSFLIGFTSVALLTPVVQGAPISGRAKYRVTAIETLPGKNESTATAINNLGQVTGTSLAGALTEAAFRYDPVKGSVEEIARNSEGVLTRGFGLNDAGIVVGDSTFGTLTGDKTSTIRHPAIFRDGSSADLGRLRKSDRHGRATDINNQGTVVGFIGSDADGLDSHAFAWSKAAGMFELGTLGGTSAQALAINDAGFVTGYSELEPRLATGESHAFLCQALPSGKVAKLIDLGTLGGSFSYGMAISEQSYVAGYSTINQTDARIHAFLFNGGKMRDLGSLGRPNTKTDQSFALGVNSNGQVVGFSFLPADRSNQQVAFVYENGAMQDLNVLIGSAADRYLIYAGSAINDQGQIAATAFDYKDNVFRAVLLTPIATIIR